MKAMPPLTAAEAMRADEVVAEIHTSASDVGGASSISRLCEPESCLLPSLDCPEWALPLEDWACRRQPYKLKLYAICRTDSFINTLLTCA